jgi:hypothetical protein
MHISTGKRFLFIVAFLSVFSSSFACDICGCGLGNYYIGLVPQFNKHFIGLRYQYQSFHTQLASDPSQFSNDYFQTIEVWGGMNIGKRWQVLAFVPFNFNQQNSDDGIERKNGLGDVAALLNYSLLEKSSSICNDKMMFQQLWVGAGVKLPTGKAVIDPSASDLVALANSQLGSGSTDFMLNAAYSLHIDKWGFTTNANYKMNTENKESYRFGNRIASNSFLFYTIKTKAISITPNIGFQYEHTNGSSLQNQKVDETGGYSTFGTIGVEASVGKINIGMNLQNPLSQEYASGQTKANTRAMVHVTFSL